MKRMFGLDEAIPLVSLLWSTRKLPKSRSTLVCVPRCREEVPWIKAYVTPPAIPGIPTTARCCWLLSALLLAVPGCYFFAGAGEKRGFLRPRPDAWLFFAGLSAVSA